MTDKNFSAGSLPYPKYNLEIGTFSIELDKDLKMPNMIPNISDTIQLVEVKFPGTTLNSQTTSKLNDLFCSYIWIYDARPELFIRRDFIAEFVNKGTINLYHDDGNLSYTITTSNNVMNLVMTEKQYHRFGLIAKSKFKDRNTNTTYFKVEINLRDDRIMKSNKYQDKLMTILKRLNCMKRLYFRFVPDKSSSETAEAANLRCLEFFKQVIKEYELDGIKPIPLSNCTKVTQSIERTWKNFSQLHPSLDICSLLLKDDRSLNDGLERDLDGLSSIILVVDWLGYQLLSIDCNQEEISCQYRNDGERLDVSCVQIRGPIDLAQLKASLANILRPNDDDDDDDDGVVMRALILYSGDKSLGVCLIQDCSVKQQSGDGSIIVIGMSGDTNL